MIPSKYQRLFFKYLEIGRKNIVMDAVAGSGKSTTLIASLKMIPAEKQALFLAFNKAIVEELKIKAGNINNVEIKTLHSLGASILMKNLRCDMQNDKYRTYINNAIKNGSINPSVQSVYVVIIYAYPIPTIRPIWVNVFVRKTNYAFI